MSEVTDEKKEGLTNKLKKWWNNFKPKINVGIDFGTDGTGDTQERVFIYDKWKVHSGQGNNANKSKIRTAILLDSNNKCIAIGSNALTSYVFKISLMIIYAIIDIL